MGRKTFCVSPQRLQPNSGYVPCQPHQAARWVVVETTEVPAKSGRRKYQVKRNLAIFSGGAAEARAHDEVRRLTGHTGARQRGKLWGESLTRAQYNEVTELRRGVSSHD